MTLNYDATLRPMIVEISKQVSYKFPRSVLREDVEQDLWLWAYSKKKSITNTIESHPEAWVEQIAATMRKQAMSFGSREKKAAEGAAFQDYQKYSVPEIRALLMDAFDYEDWQSFQSFGDGQPRGRAQANTTGDRIASLVDVKSALERLPEDQYNSLVWHYKYGFTFDDLAEQYGTSTDAARKRVERAVKAVQRILGPQPQQEYTGRRRVASNASWQAINSNYYEE